jgi:hypothetical protein
MRIVAGVGDLMQRIGVGRTGRILMVGRSGGRVMPCAVYTVHEETRSADFLVEPQNHGRRVVSDLASKPLGAVFSGLASKPVATVSLDLALKPVVSFLVETQNQGGGGFLG